jgi:hypothetical protein
LRTDISILFFSTAGSDGLTLRVCQKHEIFHPPPVDVSTKKSTLETILAPPMFAVVWTNGRCINAGEFLIGFEAPMIEERQMERY